MDTRPLILHVVYRFDTGGLENGVVNLINHMDPAAFRHAVMALTEVTGFAQRIQRPDVAFISLRKPPGQGVWHYQTWRRELMRLKPDIVHTRNLGALEMQVPAWAAGVKGRIHGEHGRDMSDPEGRVRKYQWVRRAYSPFVHRYIALSQDLARYLVKPVGIARDRVQTICNGVDTEKFSPAGTRPEPIEGCPFRPDEDLIIGTVGRLQPEKDQLTLIQAFAQARARDQAFAQVARLVLVGEGSQRSRLETAIAEAGIGSWVWMAGERRDVPQVLRGLHIFCLPSRAEGISNTILEAMASGLPVVATAVGGNAELVAHGETGWLVPAADGGAMSEALLSLRAQATRESMAQAARQRAVQFFSLRAMVQQYQRAYSEVLGCC